MHDDECKMLKKLLECLTKVFKNCILSISDSGNE